MSNQVTVNFQVGGVADVMKALGSIEQAMLRAEQRGVRASLTGSQERVASADREAKDRVRFAEREAREKIEAYKRADRIAESGRKEGLRRYEDDVRKETRILERELATRESALKKAQHAHEQFARTIAGAAGRGIQQAGSFLLRGATGLASTALSLGGGYSIADSLGRRTREMGQATEIALQGYIPDSDKAENRRRHSGTEIHATAQMVGHEFGLGTDEVQGGLSKFVGKTGDLDTGLKLMHQLGELATATGSNFEDLASAAAEVFNSDTKQGAEDLMITLRGLAGQGKLGAVEIKDLASQAAKITASAGKFAGNKEKNVLLLGAIAQEAKLTGGATTPVQAATAVARLADTVAKNEHEFAAAGIDVRGPGGVLKAIQPLIEESLIKTKGHVENVSDLFGIIAGKGVGGFAEVYRNAGGSSGTPEGQKAGLDAVRAEFERFAKAQLTASEQQEAAQIRMQDADKKWEVAVLKLRDITADKLLPAFMNLLPSLEKAIPKFGEFISGVGDVADYLVKNPFIGIGTTIAAVIAKDVSSAAIGKIFETGLTAILNNAAGPAGGGIKGFLSAGGLAGNAAAFGTIAITATAVTIAGVAAIDYAFDTKDKDQKREIGLAIDAQNEINQLAAKGQAGTLTDEDIKKAAGIQADAQQRVDNPGVFFGNAEAFDKLKVAVGELSEAMGVASKRVVQLSKGIMEPPPNWVQNHPQNQNAPLTERGGAGT